MLNGENLRILLIEDNPGDVLLLEEALYEAVSPTFALVNVSRLEEAIKALHRESFDLILLDLSLPDSSGLRTFVRLQEQVKHIPVVVLTGTDDDMLGQEAVGSGAQDYLVKGSMENNLLMRSFCYAIARHKMQEAVRAVSLKDDLTGLENRRSFLALAHQQIRVADRTGKSLLLLYIDLDNMKWINDTFGHNEGDRALIDTANILKQTFRSSDVIARLGGDEFVVAALEADLDIESEGAFTARLHQNVLLHNRHPRRRYALEMSLGTVRYGPQTHLNIEELLAQADAAMYAQKRQRRDERLTSKTL